MTSWTAVPQVLLSMGFSRQDYWNGLPFPSPGDLPNPGIEPLSPVSPALAGRFFTFVSPGKPCKRAVSVKGRMEICKDTRRAQRTTDSGIISQLTALTFSGILPTIIRESVGEPRQSVMKYLIFKHGRSQLKNSLVLKLNRKNCISILRQSYCSHDTLES